MGTILFILIIAGALVGVLVKLYVKAPANMAFIRTGWGGKRVVIDGGAIVWPWIQSLQWISLETFKLEVNRANKDAFITKDRMRVDIGAEFYVKIDAIPDAIERASRSLGDKSFSAGGIQALVEEKLVSALRSVAAQMELLQMHENRRGFALAVMENLKDALIPNGLSLEDVSMFHLDQTDRSQLDPGNIFDAEGLRQIAAQTSERTRQRNEIERNTEVAIKKKDVEAVKLKLQLDQERDLAEAEQHKAVEVHRAQRKAETEQFRYEQDQKTREAEIAKLQAIRFAEIAQERAIREADIRREASLLTAVQERERTEILKEQAIEAAKREKEIAILIKERERLEEERRRLEAEAAKEQAAQEVVTAAERVAAERGRDLALVAAVRELQVAEKKAAAQERMATARMKEGEAEAHARMKLREAENALDQKIINRDILMGLIEKLPQIVGELMAPAKQIESIKVLDVKGLAGGGDAGPQGSVERVIHSFLSAGAALPLLREFLDFSKGEPQQLIQQITEKLPVVKELLAAAPKLKGD
jgi:uncharacterized membrane protein YqiK